MEKKIVTAFDLMVAFGMLDSYVRDGETRVRLPGGVRVSTPRGREFTVRNEDGLVLRLPDTATIDELIRALREAGVPL